MLSFSQRKGLKPIRTIVQIDSTDEPLRNQLWNVLHWNLWSKKPQYSSDKGGVSLLLRRIWIHYYDLTADEIPGYCFHIVDKVKHDFLKGDWYVVYDFIQFILNNYNYDLDPLEPFTQALNLVLEKYLSGYRIVERQVVDITSKQELESIEDALKDTSILKPVNLHLIRALQLLSDREHPDYRNSIKESISAVEALCNVITGKPKATLGQTLAEIEKSHQLHSALKESFSKLYGWTSDASGIRHKLLDGSTLNQEDAKFMLITCSAFINYLLVKADTQK